MNSLTNFSPQAESGLPLFFLYCLWDNIFFVFKWLEKKSKEYMITYENYIKFILQFQKIKFHWKESCLFIYIFSVAAFALQEQS